MSQSSAASSSSLPPSSQIPPPDYYEPPQRRLSTPSSQMVPRSTSHNPPPLLTHSTSNISQASTIFSMPEEDDERPPDSPSSSSRGSPPLISATTTPIVPPSGANPQCNPFPASPCIAASTAGSKRTASGTVKSTLLGASGPGSPATPETPRFARIHTGIDASPRDVSQISTTLRTRLTYALLKLENNWTTESIGQIEARVAQGQYLSSSPSPRVCIKREPSVGDDQSASLDSIRRHTRTNSEPNTAHPTSAGSAAGRTYEAFWKNHRPHPAITKNLKAKAASQALGVSTNTHTPQPTTPSSSHSSQRSGSGLQPPAQIVSDRDRRSYYNPPRNPPTLTTAGSNLSNYSTYSNTSIGSMVANTPPPLVAQRSMEQDAVESLMFLSSPGNSRPSSQQTISSTQNSQHSQPPVATFLPSPTQPPSRTRHSYARNATTWPRDRPRHKQQRTGLEGLGVTIRRSGADEDEDDVTDEDIGPDSVNERARDGRSVGLKNRGGKSANISPVERVPEVARHRGDVGNASSRPAGAVSTGGGRVRMGASSSSAATIRG
ncbi:hypothetical protein HOY80DRAFT_988459 [Tuber brumale]|nr:hypothetical protein HOY80DRAFT_988459 [Tuber brumale]